MKIKSLVPVVVTAVLGLVACDRAEEATEPQAEEGSAQLERGQVEAPTEAAKEEESNGTREGE